MAKIDEYLRPNNIKELKRFLGMANYYREFTPRFAEVAAPLQELDRKGTIYAWTDAREEAFTQLKKSITTECLLNVPDWSKPFVIELDGSKVSAGAVILQEIDNKQKILGFHSSTLDPAQKNYGATELECWATISSCRRFRGYIKGAPKLILRADHEPLKWPRKQHDPRGKFSRWIMELEQYEYVFEYKSGKTNVVPDALSRVDIGRAITDADDSLEDGIFYVKKTANNLPPDWNDLLRREQRREASINIAIEQLEEKNNISLGRFKYYKQLAMQDGLLTKSGRILVPSCLRYQITKKDFHNTNHWGVTNTLKEISKQYYWTNMKNYVEQFCASCDTCLQTKHPSKKPKAELKPMVWADYEPCQAIALDIATMTSSYDGFNHILLITDCMSKFTELCPLRNMTADSVVKNVKRNWIARHGIPVTLLTDQGSQVDGVDIRKLCDELGIKKKRSSPYHPEGDGISERPIGVMKGLFRRKLCDDKIPQRRWTDLLPEVQLALNQKEHSATKHTPFQLLYGELKNTNHEERAYMKNKSVKEAKSNLNQAAARMKKQYDKNSVETQLRIGDYVYVKRNFVKKGVSKKLSTMFYDLSTITEVNHPIYKIKSENTKQEKWLHHNRLKKRGILQPDETSQPTIENRSSRPKKENRGIVEPPPDFDIPFHAIPIIKTPTPVNVNEGGSTDNETNNNTNVNQNPPLDAARTINPDQQEQPSDDEPGLRPETTPIAEDASDEPTPSLGRTFDDNGRLTRNVTKRDEFIYFV